VTGVLSRLIDHALDPGGALQPRTPGRFEPAGGRADVMPSAWVSSHPPLTHDATASGPMSDVSDRPPTVTRVARPAPSDRSDRPPAPAPEAAPRDPIGVAEAEADIVVRGRSDATTTSPAGTRSLRPWPQRWVSPVPDVVAAPAAQTDQPGSRERDDRTGIPASSAIRRDVEALPGPALDEPARPEPARSAEHERRGDAPGPPASPVSLEPVLPASMTPERPAPVATGPVAREPRRTASPPATTSPDRRPPPGHGVPSLMETGASELPEGRPRIAVAPIRRQIVPRGPTGAILDEDRWRPAPSTRAGPIVRVSIGRIEVRAVSAPAPPRRAAAAPRSAAPSLEEYLRARNGSG
jgi:hypothetical protein